MIDAAPESVDTKAPDAFRTIGEVATMLGVRQHVLRYWEDQFPQLRPLTRAGGRRYYRKADVALAAEINRLLHTEGFTIRGARQLLAVRNGKSIGDEAETAPSARPVRTLGAEIQIGSDPAIALQLHVLRNRLATALERDSALA
jgi:DNA-binding transcriptional MerR regulator